MIDAPHWRQRLAPAFYVSAGESRADRDARVDALLEAFAEAVRDRTRAELARTEPPQALWVGEYGTEGIDWGEERRGR